MHRPLTAAWSERGLTPLALLIALLLVGCASVDRSRYAGVSKYGANGQTVERIGPLFRSKSMYFIPGREEAMRPADPVDCSDKRIRIRVAAGPETSSSVPQLCDAAAGALKYLDREVGVADVRFTIDVIPEGMARSFLVTRYRTRPDLTFAVPDIRDRDLATRNIVDLVGHEGFHVFTRVLGQESRSTDEVLAYLNGLCAQLDFFGSVHESYLPGSVMQTQLDSSSAASLVRSFVVPLLENGTLRVNDPGAARLVDRCRAGV